jgi:hypothetical protein
VKSSRDICPNKLSNDDRAAVFESSSGRSTGIEAYNKSREQTKWKKIAHRYSAYCTTSNLDFRELVVRL